MLLAEHCVGNAKVMDSISKEQNDKLPWISKIWKIWKSRKSLWSVCQNNKNVRSNAGIYVLFPVNEKELVLTTHVDKIVGILPLKKKINTMVTEITWNWQK